MSHSAYPVNNKSRWLQPLASHSEKNGPWLLTQDTTPALVAKGVICQRVSFDDFLHLLSGIVNSSDYQGSTEMCPIWTSACGDYCVMWHKEQSNTSRLFVQQADDYYARIELHVKGAMRVAFQEPVWPHLQDSTKGIKNDYLSIPDNCLEELKADGSMPDSANSANHDDQCDEVASA